MNRWTTQINIKALVFIRAKPCLWCCRWLVLNIYLGKLFWVFLKLVCIFAYSDVSWTVLTNLSEMPLTFVAAKNLCLKGIKMGTILIKSGNITKCAHLYTTEDNYTKYKIQFIQTYERANRCVSRMAKKLKKLCA